MHPPCHALTHGFPRYVPKPSPEVFRITKTNHNILQGVADPQERLSEQQGEKIAEWISRNAHRYWLPPGGPLSARSDGGADVIFIDDPQMPGLIPLAKKRDPDRPILFRSHIQIRSDLADKDGTPTSEVWKYLWSDIQKADVFISHPVKSFVPNNIPTPMVGYMPATTDWLDGLNKNLSAWDVRFHIRNFNLDCEKSNMAKLDYPKREYIIQFARFDPAKGIPDVIRSYGILRRKYMEKVKREETPQLVVTGVSAIDDPDGAKIFDNTMELIENDYPELADDISVVRLGSIDQQANALLSRAKVALQLSTREGFEVKVSEAIHKGLPTVATKAGGIPLQVQHGKSGFLVEPGDTEAVASYLHQLFADKKLYQYMSVYAMKAVSDEVHTVGNAISWLYLAEHMSQGECLRPQGKWINDLAREEAGQPYGHDESQLPRSLST